MSSTASSDIEGIHRGEKPAICGFGVFVWFGFFYGFSALLEKIMYFLFRVLSSPEAASPFLSRRQHW